MKFLFIFSAFFFISLQTLAQDGDLGSWNILNLKYNINHKWSSFAEAQLRSLKFYNHFHYYEYKAGFNYEAYPNLRLSLGMGSYQTYKEGGDFVRPKNNNELRIWPQLILLQNVGKSKIEQRYRTELRFTSRGYRNRFRYRVGWAYHFGKTKNGQKNFQINASNEIFFTDREPYFERNRWLIALAYKASPTSTLQVGYLHQFDYKINDETGIDFLQIAYLIEILKSAKP